jgi:hypothetical protein
MGALNQTNKIAVVAFALGWVILVCSDVYASELSEAVIQKVQAQHSNEIRNGSFKIAKSQHQVAVSTQRLAQAALAGKSTSNGVNQISSGTHPNLAIALAAASQGPQRVRGPQPKKLPPPPPPKKK